jgi:Sulfotransferase domain
VDTCHLAPPWFDHHEIIGSTLRGVKQQRLSPASPCGNLPRARGPVAMNLRDESKKAFLRLPPGARRAVLHALGRYAPWEEGFDPTPPPLEPGEQIGPPDFVGIGVQKAGTTWWYELIRTHPDVFSRPGIHKERHFLDRYGATPFGIADVERYHGWFPRRTGTIAGEWTPDYFSFPWAPRLLRQAAPSARLLLLLRDPVERFRSGLDHLDRMGSPRDTTAVADAVERGFYGRLLSAWLEEFERDQLLILQYERCVVDRDTELERTFRHLGLEPPRASSDLGDDRRRPEPRAGLDDEVRARLVELYAEDVAALATGLPDLQLAFWPNFAYLAPGSDTLDDGAGENSPTERA